MDGIVRMAQAAVTRDLAKDIRESDIATSLRLSRSRFGRRFRRETGQTFKSFVLMLRMKKAREMLLADPTLRIQQVAGAVGYMERKEAAFARDFKKCWGYPPSDCKKMAA